MARMRRTLATVLVAGAVVCGWATAAQAAPADETPLESRCVYVATLPGGVLYQEDCTIYVRGTDTAVSIPQRYIVPFDGDEPQAPAEAFEPAAPIEVPPPAPESPVIPQRSDLEPWPGTLEPLPHRPATVEPVVEAEASPTPAPATIDAAPVRPTSQPTPQHTGPVEWLDANALGVAAIASLVLVLALAWRPKVR